MFIDSAEITVKAGDGGNGIVSWRKERFVDRGGPDGGDGGDGGDVVVVADPNLNSLAPFRHRPRLAANNGASGGKQRRHGKSSEDVLVKVPLGTEVWHDNQLITDLLEKDTRVVVAKGGPGGFGNAHFTSSTRQAPAHAELGEPGEQKSLRLELKLIADVGLVGLPNAGKSTFLSVVTSARPKIADYPFTTLTPNLGVADIENASLLIADIPGLIEGAAAGKGLGDEFLRHIERTALLLHLVDGTAEDPAGDYKTIRRELKLYKNDLAGKPSVVAVTKLDALAPDQALEVKKSLEHETGTEVFMISSPARTNVDELLRELLARVDAIRAEVVEPDTTAQGVPVYELERSDDFWEVHKKAGHYIVSGVKIERFAVRTDLSNREAVRRLKAIMRKMGIMHELQRHGVLPGDKIIIAGKELEY